MDGLQLRDEAAQDRVRAATEFLDPSKSIVLSVMVPLKLTKFFFQMMHGHAGSSISKINVLQYISNRLEKLSSRHCGYAEQGCATIDSAWICEIPCQELVLIILDRSASMKSEHTTGSLPMGNSYLYNKCNWVHQLMVVGCSLRRSIIHKPLTLR
jgi:hypothetical protein